MCGTIECKHQNAMGGCGRPYYQQDLPCPELCVMCDKTTEWYKETSVGFVCDKCAEELVEELS